VAGTFGVADAGAWATGAVGVSVLVEAAAGVAGGASLDDEAACCACALGYYSHVSHGYT
jgi:hypothetical protein